MPLVTGPSAIQPVEIPDMVGNYARVAQLRSQMQNAPLQHQLLQQSVDSGAIENQKQHIALKDQEAMNAAMQEWSQPKAAPPAANPAVGMTGGPPAQPASPSMPNYDDLIDLAKKHGASFSAIQGLQKSVLDMKDKAATIAKDDAETGKNNADTLKTKNGMLIDAMTGIMNLPNEQLAPTLLSASQELAAKGLLDPQHVQMAQQLAQSGDPAAIRKQLSAQIAGMGGFSKIMDEAQKKIDLQKKQQESNYYAQNGGVPGVPVETMELNDYLKKNPGKTPSDFVKFKAQNSPSVIVQNSAAGSAPGAGGAIDWAKAAQKYGMTPSAFDQTAEKYFSTGQLPSIGRSANAIAMQRDLMNRAAELHPNASLAANSAEYKANSESLKKLQTNFDQVNAFENTALKNMDLLQQKAQQIPDLGSKFSNIPVRMINDKMIGTENMAAFKTALATAQTEAAKVLNSSSANGVLSDSARHELQVLIDPNSTYKAMVASLNTLRQDMENRKTSYQSGITDIQTRLGASAAGATGTPKVGDIKTFPNGKKGKWDGTGWEAQ